jgi:hypothetical protein
MKREIVKERSFEVIGAGRISMTETCTCLCGGETGFGLGVTWGKYGIAGGVLPISEAKNLANFILKSIKKDEILRHKEV